MINISKVIKLIIFSIIFLLYFIFSNYLNAENIDIHVYETNNTVRLVLTSNNSFSSNVFILENPSRLVIDIKNINNFSKNNSNFNYIKRIRASKNDNVSRLVFDLKVPIVKYSKNNAILKKNGNNILIIDLTSDLINFIKTNLNTKIIVIDAGHGGADPGAIRNKIKEKNLTLMAAKILKEKLEKKSFKVFLTRSSDRYIRLKNRVKFARSKSADLFISIHADSTKNKNTNGTSIYSLSEKASDKLSQALADRENKSDLIGGLDLEDLDKAVSDILIDLSRRETKNSSIDFAELFVNELKKNGFNLLRRPHRQAGFAVLKAPDIPSVLIEMGFISNNDDLNKLTRSKFQENLMKSIAMIIEKYFKPKR
ncbi:MAG TPA: N-acetylmuramoyl-L-alanine amidase [Alphaproteobacteria bacterium]|nr:N-acetylmuramoyl-L-alanine amidase [Alphaproteobacteria bacterium]